jgi:hypothetical protein
MVLLDYATVPFATVDPRVPEWYGQVAREQGSFALLPVPMSTT